MIVFDLDGTLRDASCGDHLVPGDVTLAKNWLPWQNYVNEFGGTITHGLLLYRLAHSMGHDVVIATSSQYGTLEWLESHGLPVPHLILERRETDNSTPFEYKKRIIDRMSHVMKMWIDDSVEMCDYVKSLGIEVIRVGG